VTLVDGVEVGDWASEGKLWCPGCDSQTSTIKGAWERGEGCPYCGLSSGAMTEVAAARYRHGETVLTERLAELLKRAEKAETEAGDLRRKLQTITNAIRAGEVADS
jgi:hypothetical protein